MFGVGHERCVMRGVRFWQLHGERCVCHCPTCAALNAGTVDLGEMPHPHPSPPTRLDRFWAWAGEVTAVVGVLTVFGVALFAGLFVVLR